MALTRPTIYNLNTNIEVFNESMTVLNAGASSANVDVGFIFNRAHGLVANTAMYWSEGLQSFVYAFTNNAGVTTSNITISNYANVQVGNILFVNGAGLYINGTLGSAGSVLGSNGTSLSWVAGGGFTGGTIYNTLTISNTTPATSTTSGALQVTGGAGIAGNIYIGGNCVVSGNITRGATSVLDNSNTITSIGTGATTIDSFANTAIRSAKYIISTQDVTTSQSQVAEILLVQDGANVNIVTYGVSWTGPNQRMTFSANISSGTVTLWASGISTNNTVKLTRTAIPM